MEEKAWFKKSYRRNLVDMHIEDWDERFLSLLDPEKYVAMLKLANVKSAMVYANSHVGYCYWPTKTGHMHKGLGGKDFLGTVIKLCHMEGIDVIVYYSLIYNNWAYKQHPEWRIKDINEKSSRDKPAQNRRYGVCCPNSEYRKFVLDQIEELCRNHKFEGIFFDMTFWPTVCYCSNCRERYKQEEGESLPTTIHWDDPSWIKFQKKREKWLAEFAALATSAVKRIRPEIAVEHQSSTLNATWKYGVTSLLAEQCDYLDGDYYGGSLQQSFICKLFYNLTKNMPFVFSTSICHNLHDHTTTKPKELIEAQAFLAVAHNGAFLIIDAIDPTGTLEERRYRIVGDVFNEIGRYEKYLGGELCQDVAIYFSFDSKVNPAENGKQPSPEVIEKYSWTLPHLDAALGCVETLRTNHVPFGVITKKNLKELSRHQVVILPNILKFSDEEAEAIKKYVAEGGSVYASKFTLKSKLAEILGISSIEESQEKYTYIAPTSEAKFILPEISEKYPLSIPDSQIKANYESKDGIMAKIVLPYTDPNDSSKFVSIHSNPPGVSTDYPAIVQKKIDKGTIIWSSASIETYAVKSLRHRTALASIIRSLAKEPFSFEAKAPGCTEIVLFHKPDQKRYLINIVNFQSEIGMPNIPVKNIIVKVKVKRRPLKITSIPEGKNISFKQNGEYVYFKVSMLQTFRMLTLNYA